MQCCFKGPLCNFSHFNFGKKVNEEVCSRYCNELRITPEQGKEVVGQQYAQHIEKMRAKKGPGFGQNSFEQEVARHATTLALNKIGDVEGLMIAFPLRPDLPLVRLTDLLKGLDFGKAD
jgi:hypothetical protein